MEYVLLFFLVEYWIGCNIAVISTMTKEEMKEDFITNQNLLGKICANTFYCLAWAFKNKGVAEHE